jgi:hypothetical protein
MAFILVAVYFIFFSFLAWKNFRLAFVFFLILLPSYLIRFQIGPLPSTVLELSFGALFLIWLIKYSRYDIKNIIATSQKHKILFIAFDLFFVSSVVSVLISDLLILSLGVWRAYFLEPMILFLIARQKKRYKNKGLNLGFGDFYLYYQRLLHSPKVYRLGYSHPRVDQ